MKCDNCGRRLRRDRYHLSVRWGRSHQYWSEREKYWLFCDWHCADEWARAEV